MPLTEKKSWKLTAEDRAEIIKRARRGDLQKEICKDMHLDKETIRRVEHAAGIRRHPGYVLSRAQEKDILRLLRDHGVPFICRTLTIPVHVVRRVQLTRLGKTGGRHFTKAQLRAIGRELVNARQRIAARWKVSDAWLRAFWNRRRKLHRETHKPQPTSDPTLDLVTAVIEKLYGGVMPDEAALLNALTAKFTADFRQQASDAIQVYRIQTSGNATVH